MTESCGLRTGALSILVLGFAQAILFPMARAQSPDGSHVPQLVPRTPQERERAYEAQRRVNLHVVVTDGSGKPITGLKPEDFTVLDHGQPKQIVRFAEVTRTSNDGTRGLVVLDAINDGLSGVNRIRKELAELLEQDHGPLAYPLEIAVASDAGVTEDPPTTDRSRLIAELRQPTQKIQSIDCDRATGPGRLRCQSIHLARSLNALNWLAGQQQKAKDRAIVIWTGPGWPLPAVPDDGLIAPGAVTTGHLSSTIVALEADMEEGQLTLEAVSWGSFERAQGVRRTGLQGSLAGAGLPEQEAALEVPALAEQTGGLALEKSKNLADALNACLIDGNQYYAVAFDPAPATTPDEYRSIEVKIDRPGATVRTLTGYYAQP